ncbi:MAG: hypothetical protein M3336_05200 [Chloroflexota bacterium]|nr:hypothetical protein [Chloroflexota bacterium]
MILSAHQLLANALVLYYALVGLWGLLLALRRQPVTPAYGGALAIGLIIAVVQAVVGLALLVSGGRPRDHLHYLNGLSVIDAEPLAQHFLSTRTWNRPVAYALACLFTAGLAIRGITTGA